MDGSAASSHQLPDSQSHILFSHSTLKLTLRMLITTLKILSALITIYNNTDNSGFLIFQACTTVLPCQQHSHQKTQKSNNLKINAVKLLLIYTVFSLQKTELGQYWIKKTEGVTSQ